MGFLPIAPEVYSSKRKSWSQFVGTMRFFLVIAEYVRRQQMIGTPLELLLTVSIFYFPQIKNLQYGYSGGPHSHTYLTYS
jgi:hypothetical protein